jgi:sulfoxide reductase heme-binding subunit YedZ
MARMGAWLMHPLAKPAVFVAALLPFAWLFYGALTNSLGANPAEYLIRSTGDWALRFLCMTLAVTPVRVVTGTAALARFRRMLGLFVYFYVVLHLLSYSWFDMGFDVGDIIKDIIKRPFILVGFAAFLLLTPLAATSFNRAIKALGAKRWQTLHKLVYVIAGPGHPALLLDAFGQERLCRGGDLCRYPGGAAGLAAGALLARAQLVPS